MKRYPAKLLRILGMPLICFAFFGFAIAPSSAEVVASDILNCGAKIDMSRRVIIDDDVVTGYGKHEVVSYVQAVAEAIATR